MEQIDKFIEETWEKDEVAAIAAGVLKSICENQLPSPIDHLRVEYRRSAPYTANACMKLLGYELSFFEEKEDGNK